jgi:signal transduction histidine kinase/CheY-like chemotaxis protein
VLADRQSLSQDPNRPKNIAAAVTGPDFTLGAYATCVVHSIDADKVMVSLLDDTTQYFLGGATKHTSSVAGYDENPELWFGCNSIGITGGICEVACSVTPDASHYPFYIIPDIADEPQWRDVVGDYRFYAGIPIKTPSGYNIGTLFAFSTRPRLELTPAERLIMERMAGQIMNHLELELNVLERNRLLIMNQSLARFASSRDTTTFDKTSDPPANPLPHASTAGAEAAAGGGGEEGTVDLGLNKMLPTPADTTSTFGGSAVQAVPRATAESSTVRGSSHSSLYVRAANILRSGIDCTGVIFLSIDRENFHVDSHSHVTLLGGTTAINEDTVQQQPFSAQVLRELLHLYPEQGQMFYFDSKGGSWPTTEDDLSTSMSCQPHLMTYPENDTLPVQDDDKERYGRHLATRLRRSIPAAQQLLIVPLKSTRDELLGAVVAWSDNWDRVMTRSVELSFTLCFCANVFAEVLHQEAIVANRQKADFIANVSHELRSPLHGILASSELLKDTGGTELQHSLMEDVQSCGRVLLNTIDHVLDFSNLIRSEQKNPRAMRERNDSVIVSGERTSTTSHQSYGSRQNPLILNQPINFNLAALCEDVVDSVFISRFFHSSVSSSASRVISPGLANIATQSPPVVSLSISPHDWNFLIQPGAIQRIIMNLLGNAIKYTATGFIRVTLTMEETRSSQTMTDSESDSTVILVVSDSGRGLSPDYIRTRLWCAFAQEDQTVHGTGLGLSITKKIVNMLGGTIDLQSTVNVGTTVTMKLPLQRVSESERRGSNGSHLEGDSSHHRPTQDVTAQLLDMRRLGEGRTVAVFLRSAASGASYLEHHTPQVKYANEALVGCLTEWFALRVIWQLESDSTVDLVIVDEERLGDVQIPPNTPHVILKDSSYVRSDDRGPVNSPCAYVRRPVAPLKLERALREVLSSVGNNAEHPNPNGKESLLTVDHRPKRSPVHPAVAEPIPFGSVLIPAVRTPAVQLKSLNNSTAALPDRLATQTPVDIHNAQQMTRKAVEPTSSLPTASAKSSTIANSQTSIPRVLVVDDNSINLKVLSAYLYKHHIPKTHIIAAVDGLDAVQQFTQSHINGQSFDIVLMDLNMPVKDGFEAITEIRTYEKVKEMLPIMVVALTGLVSERDQERAFVAGADQFFSKPFSGKQVGSLLDVWRREWSHKPTIDSGT